MKNSLDCEILALDPEEAVQVLERAGVKYEVEYTGPVRFLTCGGRERVVRFRFRGNTGVITIAREQIPAPQKRVEHGSTGGTERSVYGHT